MAYSKRFYGSYELVQVDTVELHDFMNTKGEGYMHSHDFWELGYVISGSGLYSCGDIKHEVKPGDLMITLPGDIHYESRSPRESVKILFLLFKNTFSPDKSFGIPFKTSCAISTDRHPRIQQTCMNILLETLERKPGYEYMINTELTKLFILLSRIMDDSGPKDVFPDEDSREFPDVLMNTRKLLVVSEIKEYIARNLSEELNISNIAPVFYMSPQHLTRIFKEASGISPKQYQNRVRTEKAKYLLKATGDDIADIALTLGFKDVSHFYRFFKKEASMTPVQYRTGKTPPDSGL